MVSAPKLMSMGICGGLPAIVVVDVDVDDKSPLPL